MNIRCAILAVAFMSASMPAAVAQTDEKLRRMYFAKDFTAMEALARQGDVRAEAWMGLIMQQAGRRTEAKEWWGRAAAKGNRWAISSLASIHHHDKEVEQALYWYRRSAELGNPSDQATLAWLLINGKGYPLDEQEGFHWYRAAVAQRDVHSYLRLAELYAAGRGTVRDPVEAYALSEIAVAILTGSDQSDRDRARALRTKLASELSLGELERARERIRELRPGLPDAARR
jgi:TPR repeat protein